MMKLQVESLKNLDVKKRETQYLSSQANEEREKLRIQLDFNLKAYSELDF